MEGFHYPQNQTMHNCTHAYTKREVTPGLSDVNNPKVKGFWTLSNIVAISFAALFGLVAIGTIIYCIDHKLKARRAKAKQLEQDIENTPSVPLEQFFSHRLIPSPSSQSGDSSQSEQFPDLRTFDNVDLGSLTSTISSPDLGEPRPDSPTLGISVVDWAYVVNQVTQPERTYVHLRTQMPDVGEYKPSRPRSVSRGRRSRRDGEYPIATNS